ncbi:hypothetical protein, partial [Desulfovibrio inopinatus]|uniref:hypothetical protein n=1 Tax=Desulfovibrio inopinatus TaxID=102109 RepID=UPI000551FE68
MAKKRNYEDELESQLAAIVGGDAKNRMTEVLSRQGPNPDELFKKNTVGRQKTVDETGHDQTIKQEPDQMVSPNGVTRSDHGVTRSD